MPVKPTPTRARRPVRQLLLGDILRSAPVKKGSTARAAFLRLVRDAKRKGWTRRELATYLGISPRQLYRYLAGNKINPWIARAARAVQSVTREKITLGP